jgi:gamma-glutamylcyclotransferase (GGCT)/AIG2-like uncharacterized protein YtfP
MKRIFVYGSLRKGEVNHGRFMGFGDVHLATGTVSGAVLKDLGAYPAAVPSSNDGDRIVGEVYEISDELAALLDRFEREEAFEARPVIVVDDSGNVPTRLDAIAYFPIQPDRFASHPTVAGGDWAKHDHRRPAS